MDQFQQPSYQPPVTTPGGFSVPAGSTVFSPPPTKKNPAKNIILVGVLILVLIGLIFGFDKARSFLSQAEGACTPDKFEEANLTSNSIEIRFQTEKACQTEILYGTSEESLLLKVPEAMAAISHRIKLSPLLPSTTYYYQMMVDDKKVGVVRSFLTLRSSGSQGLGDQPQTVLTAVPTVVPTGTKKHTIEDFKKQWGRANAEFDLDKNGIVNSSDWLLYLKKSTP